DGKISEEIARKALQMFEVDGMGLDNMDRKILATIIEKFSGGPVGLETIAVAVGEETETITDVYEPFLIQSGFLERTPRGRMVTKSAYEHLKLPKNSIKQQGELF
ncbi:Holliday junction branch migration DNA helicase RuvB, partial [bacterium]|nr:Holliday junction branch migration DNA helicase RuvB [bacterium]NIN92445.1 Holliday junction branch migration DNA helicase RuvB [bacterium]NIO18559.1 Holliday junction branch migration DNA helicase RuvB [bacterium]NIO73555.1 Holliday junction branch migration DNA helicase RuvB [bacterium]